jgi:hypothetical protein
VGKLPPAVCKSPQKIFYIWVKGFKIALSGVMMFWRTTDGNMSKNKLINNNRKLGKPLLKSSSSTKSSGG